MSRLPTSPDALSGLRAARWVRESTTGQFDRYGPEAQAELQDGAIERLGLLDTGLEWRIAHSGRTAYRSPALRPALAGSPPCARRSTCLKTPCTPPGSPCGSPMNRSCPPVSATGTSWSPKPPTPSDTGADLAPPHPRAGIAKRRNKPNQAR